MFRSIYSKKKNLKKVMAVLLTISFVLSGGIGLILTLDSNTGSTLASVTPLTAGTMAPGTLPHYFGPYANYANSPVPSGSITNVAVNTKGSGYSSPTITITDVWGTGVGAMASATVVGGSISSITITDGGTGYSAPIVTITDPTGTGATATAVMGGTLTGGIRKFIDSLPGLTEANANNLGNYIPVAVPDTTTYPGCDYFEIGLVKFTQKLSTDLPSTLLYGYVQLETPAIAALGISKHVPLTNPDGTPILKADGTRAYGVDNPHYLGPTLVASSDIPTRVTFSNLLPAGMDGDLFLPVDTTIMGAGMGPNDSLMDPPMKENYTQNRATMHLHGGATPWISDGTPHQWTTPAGEMTQYPKGVSVAYVPDMWFVNGDVVPNTAGETSAPVAGATNNPGEGSLTFYYTNQQSARLMFYHDHAYGITRLNVYAGEAAGYLLTDAVENALIDAGIIPSSTGAYTYGIPLIIQDKTFVDETTIAYQDPTWAWGSNPGTPTTGDLWHPHVYMPNQNPYDPTGANPYGRWDYGPWFFPPTDITYPPVANPYYDPENAPWEPPMIPAFPNVSATMEAFMDTSMVNGQTYPYLDLDPQAYRFRILNAANDRFFNLQLYVADPNIVTSDGRINTEVNMVPALTTPGFPENWPSDGRIGGVPNPEYIGPSFIQIGTEGGFLPTPVEVPNQPVTWNYNPKTFTMGNVDGHSLLLGSAERADVIIDFSKYAGKTLILYNDAPSAFPAKDPRNDYYTDDPNQMDIGGAPTTQAGYGPNTRTIMQIRIANKTAAPSYDLAALENAFATTSTHIGVFNASQDPIIVPQPSYNTAYNGSFPNAFVRIQDSTMNFTTLENTNINMNLMPKAIHDEMGGTYDTTYGRMMSTLGLEVPTGTAVTQMFIPLGYASPPVDILMDSMSVSVPIAGDGTQIWKITHNGVDTHAMHWHLFNIQIINRVGWDGAIIMPDANELGWKETLRVDPLSDTIVAMRPISMVLPWEVPACYRLLDSTIPEGEPLGQPPGGFFDPSGVSLPAGSVTNKYINFGWEYVWHCHLLSHEEMDMMHAMPFAVRPYRPSGLTGSVSTSNNSWVNLTWIDDSIAETGYIIQRNSTASPAFVTIGEILSPHSTTGPTSGNLMHFNDTNASDGLVYYYQVLANSIVGDNTSYPTGIGFPWVSINSTPSNLIRVDTNTMNVVLFPSTPITPNQLIPETFYLIPTTGVVTSYTTMFASLSSAMAANPKLAVSYTFHGPVRIDSNADFDAAHGVTGGSGTALAPWIIENYNIDGTGFGYGIYIGNTTDYFIVRNCQLNNATGGFYGWDYAPDSGLVFFNVTNGIAANNIMTSNAWAGIYANGSKNLMLFNLTVAGNYMGLYFHTTNDSIVSFNTISSNYVGVWLYGSHSNTFANNTITHNYPGIILASSTWNAFTNNTLFANNDHGIRFHASTNNLVINNDFINNKGAGSTYSPDHIQAYDDLATNIWNGAASGNYWSDWLTPDSTAPIGIVDLPYVIEGGMGSSDDFPLTMQVIVDMLRGIRVTPSTVSMVAGTSQAFTAQAINQFGNVITGAVITWSTNAGTITPTGGLFTAQTVAGVTGYIMASSGLISANATVTIMPGALNHISVTPSSALVIERGLSQQFIASGEDLYNNPIAGLTYIWTTTVGSITSTGSFIAQGTVGTGYVNATVGGIVGSVNVNVVFGQLTYIVVIPATMNVVAGTNQTFTATGYDAFHNVIAGLAFSWTTNVGRMNGSTLTGQTLAGSSGYVRVTSGLVNTSAFVSITPAALDHVDVTPASMVNTVVNSIHQFSAVGRDVFDNPISGLTYAWSTNIGTISGSGLFTAQAVAGTSGYVNVTSGGKIGSVNVTVTFSQLTYVVITPNSAEVGAGMNFNFSADGYDQYNNQILRPDVHMDDECRLDDRK